MVTYNEHNESLALQLRKVALSWFTAFYLAISVLKIVLSDKLTPLGKWN